MAYDQLSGDDVTVANSRTVTGPFSEVRRAIMDGMASMLLQGTDPATAPRNAEDAAHGVIASCDARLPD